MLRPHLQIQLLTAAARRVGAADGGRSQRGSIALLLLVALAVTVGSLAIANSTTNSTLRSAFQGQTRRTQAIAQSGVDSIVSELNRFENRRMLVTKEPVGAWNDSLRNPCDLNTATSLADANSLLSKAKSGNWITLAGNANQQYRLRSIQKIATKNRTQANSTYSTPAIASIVGLPGTYNPQNISIKGDESNVGYLRITVEAKETINGNNTNSTLTREFEVVPKCCNQSFGLPKDPPGGVNGVHGKDVRLCDGGSPGSGGSGDDGLYFGFNGGTLSTTGNAAAFKTYDASTDTFVNLEAIVCVENEAAGQTTTCDTWTNTNKNVSTNSGDIPVKAVDFTFPLPTFPGTTPTGAQLTKNTLCLQSRSTGVKVYKNSNCTGTVTNYSTTPSVGSPYCVQSGGQNHCLIESINLSGNNILTIDTDDGINPADPKLNLYITKDTKFGGTSGLNHLRSGAGVIGKNGCISSGSDYINNLAIYGSNNPNSGQILELRGTSEFLGFFLFAPFSTVSLSGGGGTTNICGKIWTKNLEYNGSVSFLTPPTAGVDVDEDGVADELSAQWDWIARSVWGNRLF